MTYNLDDAILFLKSRLAELNRQAVHATNRYEEAEAILEHFEEIKKQEKEEK